MKTTTRLCWVAVTVAAPLLLVYFLYAGTYQPNKEDNGFRRIYGSLTAVPTDTLQAEFQYGDICGVTPHSFFVELAGRKNRVIRFDWDLRNPQSYSFGLPNNKQVWSRLHFQVDSPVVNIFAGNGPDVFKGRMDTAVPLRQHHYPYPLFVRGFAFGDGQYLFKGFDKIGGSFRMPFILWNPATNAQVRKINPFATSAAQGLESDGRIGFDTATGQIVFVQFYRNGILTMDTDFHLGPSIRTIDTVLHGRTADGSYQEDGAEKFTNSTPQFFVNWNTDVYDGMVYINSLLRGDNENRGDFETYSDLDAYNLRTRRYEYTLKVPRLNNRKLISFKIADGRLVACYPGGIVTYRLVDKNIVITKGGCRKPVNRVGAFLKTS